MIVVPYLAREFRARMTTALIDTLSGLILVTELSLLAVSTARLLVLLRREPIQLDICDRIEPSCAGPLRLLRVR